MGGWRCDVEKMQWDASGDCDSTNDIPSPLNLSDSWALIGRGLFEYDVASCCRGQVGVNSYAQVVWS